MHNPLCTDFLLLTADISIAQDKHSLMTPGKPDNELKLKIAQTALIGVIAVGGFVCMAMKVDGGQAIVTSVISLLAFWLGHRSFPSK